jgi:hypothetical protein
MKTNEKKARLSRVFAFTLAFAFAAAFAAAAASCGGGKTNAEETAPTTQASSAAEEADKTTPASSAAEEAEPTASSEPSAPASQAEPSKQTESLEELARQLAEAIEQISAMDIALTAAEQPEPQSSAPGADGGGVDGGAGGGVDGGPDGGVDGGVDGGGFTAEGAYAAISAAVEISNKMFELKGDVVEEIIGIPMSDCADAVFYLCEDSMLADEYIIVRAVDEEAARRVEDKLKDRMEYKAYEEDGYSIEKYNTVRKGVVKKTGLVVTLFVSERIDDVVKAYESAIKQYESPNG